MANPDAFVPPTTQIYPFHATDLQALNTELDTDAVQFKPSSEDATVRAPVPPAIH